MNKRDVCLRPFRLDDVEGIVRLAAETSFLPSTWGLSFNWQFAKNPAREHERELGWVIEDADGRIVGHQMAMPYRFLVFGQERYVGISCDSFCHHQFRSQGLGTRLFLEYFRGQTGSFVLGTTTNIIPQSIWVKEGCRPIGDLEKSYNFLFRLGPILQEIQRRKLPWLSSLSGITRRIGDFGSAITGWPRLPKTGGTTVENVTPEDDRLDELWLRFRFHYPITVIRDRRYRIWRYRQAPTLENVHHYLIREPRSDLVAWLVLHIKRFGQIQVAEVMELFGPIGVPMFERAVLATTVDLARELQVDNLEICGLHPSWRRHLRQLGFLARTFSSNPFLTKTMGELDNTLLFRADNWHLVAADGDIIV